VRTDRDAFYAELDYMARGPRVTADATRWLFEQGVRVMGIDAWGLPADRAPRQPRLAAEHGLSCQLLSAAHRRRHAAPARVVAILDH